MLQLFISRGNENRKYLLLQIGVNTNFNLRLQCEKEESENMLAQPQLILDPAHKTVQLE